MSLTLRLLAQLSAGPLLTRGCLDPCKSDFGSESCNISTWVNSHSCSTPHSFTPQIRKRPCAPIHTARRGFLPAVSHCGHFFVADPWEGLVLCSGSLETSHSHHISKYGRRMRCNDSIQGERESSKRGTFTELVGAKTFCRV